MGKTPDKPMDKTLERILSLLPHNEKGNIKRGAKKDFAISLGYESGDIVSMWINDTSQSYKKKLHQIADKYSVSIEWLECKTDDPTPIRHEKIATPEVGNSEDHEITLELIEKINKLSIQDKVLASQILELMLSEEEGE